MREGPSVLKRSWSLLWEELSRWKPGMTADEWWEGEDRFFRCLGSVLVQRTAWHNAKRAIGRLRELGLTDPDAVLQASEEELVAAVRPAGFYRSKVPAIREVCRFLLQVGKNEGNASDLRDRLLQIRGIGPETADTILLYVFDQPVFVGDAYAERIASRWFGEDLTKERIREEVLCEIRIPFSSSCCMRSSWSWGRSSAGKGNPVARHARCGPPAIRGAAGENPAVGRSDGRRGVKASCCGKAGENGIMEKVLGARRGCRRPLLSGGDFP